MARFNKAASDPLTANRPKVDLAAIAAEVAAMQSQIAELAAIQPRLAEIQGLLAAAAIA